jgi:hypothetical protein
MIFSIVHDGLHKKFIVDTRSDESDIQGARLAKSGE